MHHARSCALFVLVVLAVLAAVTPVFAMTAIPGHATTYEKGDSVTVHATGVVQQTSQKFWSTKDPGQQPFSYKAGVGSVITGWDQGCLGAQLGEVRKLSIPAHEGYGENGFPAWGIPPGGGLDFTIEVLSINNQKAEL